METSGQTDSIPNPLQKIAALAAENSRLRARLAEVEPFFLRHQAAAAGRRMTRQIRRETEDLAERARRLIEARQQGHLVARPNWEELQALLDEKPLLERGVHQSAKEQQNPAPEMPGRSAAVQPDPTASGTPLTFAQAKRVFFEELEGDAPLTEQQRQALRRQLLPMLEVHWAKFRTLPSATEEARQNLPQRETLASLELEMASPVSRQHRRQLEREQAKFTDRR